MRETRRAGGVSFLFCDVVGSTSILSALGEARSDELRRDLFAMLRQPVTAYLGEEVKSQGDGLMVAFRHSVADALDCAVAMQQGVSMLSGAEGWPTLAIRVGVSTGEVTSEEGDWFGTPVVEAARLCGLARSRQILVTAHSVPAMLAAPFELRSVGPLKLKGFPEPVCCAEVPWSSVDNAGLVAPLPPALVTTGHPDAVGLTSAIALGVDCFEAAASGFARALIVSGPPRAGRTRYIAEIAAAARNRGAGGIAVLYGSGAGSDAPLGAVVEAFRRFVLWAPLDVVGPLAGVDGFGALVPALPLRLGRPPPREGPASDVEQALSATVRAIDIISRSAPVIVALDDVEGCDPATLEFIAGLMTSVPEHRVLTVVTSRTTEVDERPAYRAFVDKLDGDPAITHIELTPLARAEHRRLVAATATISADVTSTMTADIADLVENVCGTLAGDVVGSLRHLTACEPLVDEHRLRSALSSAVPYKGLIALSGDDEDVFFGRRPLVEVLVRRLTEDRFVVVTGASGSGKSSALDAGVANEFRRQGRSVTVTSPSDGDSVAAAVSGKSPPGGGLVIDQFEEIFTLWDAEPRNSFLDRLLETVDKGAYAWVAIAVRSDFFGACAQHAGLLKAMDDRTVLVGALADDELHEVIEGPAHAGGLTIEPVLTDLVIADLANESHPLPLLSHALFETWRRRRGDRLTVAEYRDAGGLRRSIAHTADRVYTTALDGVGQALARALLLRLVDVADDRPPTRRPLPIEHLYDTFGRQINTILDQLVAARLVVAHDQFVDLAHEALITEWPRFAEWIDQDRDRLRAMVQLSHAATEWDTGGRSSTDLYRGVRLDAACTLLDRGDPVTPGERAFVEASMAQREAEGRRLRRTNRRLRRQLIGAVAALIVAIGATAVAVSQQRRAERQRHDAELDALDGSVIGTADTDFALSALLATEAHRLRPDGNSLVALNRSLRALPNITRAIYPSYVSSQTNVLATSRDGTSVALRDGDRVTFVDTSTLDARGTVEIAGLVSGEYSPDDRQLATTTKDGITVIDIASQTIAHDIPMAFAEEAVPADVTWSDSSHVWVSAFTENPSGGASQPLRIVDIETGQVDQAESSSSSGGRERLSGDGDHVVAARYLGPETLSTDIISNEIQATWLPQVYDGASGEFLSYGPMEIGEGATSLVVAEGRVFVGTAAGIGVFEIDGSEIVPVPRGNRQPTRVWADPSGEVLVTGTQFGRLTVQQARGEITAGNSLAELTGVRDVFFRADSKAAFAVVGDHLVELSTTGSQPLATAPFGESAEVPFVVAATGDLVVVCPAPILATCRTVDPTSGAAIDDDIVTNTTPWLLTASEDELLSWTATDDALQLTTLDGRVLASGPGLPIEATAGWARFVDEKRTILMVMSGDGAQVSTRSMTDLAELPSAVSLEPHGQSVIAMTNDLRLLARVAVHDDGRQWLDVVDVASGRPTRDPVALPDTFGRISALTFTEDQARLLLGESAGGISEMDLTTGATSRTRYQRVTGGIGRLWFSFDFGFLFAITNDGALRWWDATSGLAFDPIRIPESAIARAGNVVATGASSRSNEYIAVAGEVGMRQWNFRFETWPEIACERAGRNLSRAEWDAYLPSDEAYHMTCPQYPSGV